MNRPGERALGPVELSVRPVGSALAYEVVGCSTGVYDDMTTVFFSSFKPSLGRFGYTCDFFKSRFFYHAG